ncbi:MAG: nitroreductase [Deltaproteobacteria bacterium]|nr:nitroreductase [Deltaproteobacteria bacterium]
MTEPGKQLNQLQQTIRERRSLRRFSARPVPDEMLDSILEAGRWAPSGLNNQPWRFALIRDPELRHRMAALTRYRKIIAGASVLIAVFLDNDSLYHREKDIQGIGACLQNMLLTAHSLDLGAVWLGEILKNAPAVGRLLELPPRYELMAVVAVGYPLDDREPDPVDRKPLAELIICRR